MLRILVVPFLVACGGEGTSLRPMPNILLVTLDTTRADHLGAYGYFRDTSPTLDALARQSILFERAIAPTATTLPTHVSILTASYPLEHGVLANLTHGGQRFVPSSKLESFAWIATEAGYQTAAFVSAAPLKSDSGIANGFDFFDQPDRRHRRGRRTTDAALKWLRALKERPFFLWVHYYDAHYPFKAPAPHGTRFRTDRALEQFIAERRIHDRALRPIIGKFDDARQSINAYDGEIRYQDDQLERLFGTLRSFDEWQKTAVVLIGDHGEGLCQHGEAGHGGTWNEQLQVPMMIRIPGQAPRRVSEVASVVDALPTLVALLGDPALEFSNENVSGRALLASGFQPQPVLSQDTGRPRDVPYRYSLTSERWKYFRVEHKDGTWTEELYDLSRDPHELRDVAQLQAEVLQDLRAALQSRLAEQRARGAELRRGQGSEPRELDPAVLEELKALGYVE
jgi:arylsulfatase A-like enzyme